MGTSVSDRVKKFRANKMKTVQGTEELRAHNRLYAARCRRKKRIIRLAEEKEAKLIALNPVQRQEVETKRHVFKHHEIQMMLVTSNNDVPSDDEMEEITIKVLKHQIKLMKSMTKNNIRARNKLNSSVRGKSAQVNGALVSGISTQASEDCGSGTGTAVHQALGSAGNSTQASEKITSDVKTLSIHLLGSGDSTQVHDLLDFIDDTKLYTALDSVDNTQGHKPIGFTGADLMIGHNIHDEADDDVLKVLNDDLSDFFTGFFGEETE